MKFWPLFRPEPIETKHASGTSVPAEWMFELFGGGVAADYAITGRQALEVPAVASGISLVSGSIAALDIIVERRQGKTWERVFDHPVVALLEDQPNDWSSTYQLIRDLVATALTHNEGALAWVNRRGDQPAEIVLYASGSFTVDYSTDGRAEPSYRIGNRMVGIADVIHLRSPFEKCPLSLAAGAIGVAHKLERHAGNLFGRGARPSGVLTFPHKLSGDTAPRIKASWQAAHGGSQSGGTAVLEEGGAFQPLSFNSVDAQFLETWRFSIIEIARAFRIPPQLLFDHERVTWANGEQAAKEWLAGLEFWMRPLEAAMRRALFTETERPDFRVRFDRDDFTSVDLTARATAVSSLISSEVINRNEARDWLGMGPRAGGEEFGNPHINPTTVDPKPPAEAEPAIEEVVA